ncbi:hypothetical protein FHK02_615 [Spirosoma sp. LMG 31448]|uniref:Uncharacterized protein n=1 Tax=Spirosoma utsteinense TaxID=2585773 RepID=A0ABR6WCJ6_9BACT|nr:hypothetical protein [Spirosoma utsteinense]MBC3794014.1 hypothetical protein [Spirosoma utsteinense]
MAPLSTIFAYPTSWTVRFAPGYYAQNPVSMQLLPIDIDDTKNNRFRGNPACMNVLDVYPDYYLPRHHPG